MKIALISIAIILIIFGIYRLSVGNRREGIVEIVAGVIEVIAECLAFL